MYSKVKSTQKVKILIIQCMHKAILKVNSQKEKGNSYYNVSYKTILKRWHWKAMVLCVYEI